jgi:hypothetical protein
MHEFGPFVITEANHMKKFGETILAFTLQMSELHRKLPGQEDPDAPGGPASAMSGDPQTPVTRRSMAAVPKTPRTHGTEQSKRSRLARSLLSGISRLTPRQSTEDDSKRLQKKKKK